MPLKNVQFCPILGYICNSGSRLQPVSKWVVPPQEKTSALLASVARVGAWQKI